MKKLISLALLLVLATSLFCGCTDNTTSTDPNTEAVSGTSSADVNTENTDSATPSTGESSDSVNDTVSSGESTESVSDNVASEGSTESVSNTASADTNLENTDSNTTPSTENKESDSSAFPEVKASPENINVYRQEVSKRLASLGEDEFFVSDEIWNVISNSDCLTGSKSKQNRYFTMFSETSGKTSKFYYPVIFRDGEMLILWYTTDSGELRFENLDKNGTIESSKGGKVHLAISDEEIVASKFGYAATYVQETGEFKVWKFGEVANTYSVPKNSIFCGLSFIEGYIFKNGTDLYTIHAPGSQLNDGTVNCIAHNVKDVIDTDYNFSYDCTNQPLFLMENGTVKCYVGWLGNGFIAPDDPSHLFDVEKDGNVE